MKQLPVRFVPNLDTVVWDSSMQYDSGTIVRDSGEDEYTLYVSKKLVPRGTSLEDTSYWLVVGDVGAGGSDEELEATVASQGADLALLQNSVSELNGRPKVYYGTCSTKSSVNTKVVTTANGDFFNEPGAILFVYFTYAHTSVSTVKLSIDTSGSLLANLGNGGSLRWAGESILCFVSTGDYLLCVNVKLASSSIPGIVLLSDSVSSTATATDYTGASPYAVKQAYDLAQSAYELAEQNGVSGSSGLGDLTIISLFFIQQEESYINGSISADNYFLYLHIEFNFYSTDIGKTMEFDLTDYLDENTYGMIEEGVELIGSGVLHDGSPDSDLTICGSFAARLEYDITSTSPVMLYIYTQKFGTNVDITNYITTSIYNFSVRYVY